jgi:hypothetical protein
MALRVLHLLGVAVAPDRALPQQPVRRRPGADHEERRPPSVREQDARLREAGHQLDQATGDEAHRDGHGGTGDAEVEVAGDGEVVGEVGRLEVAHAVRLDRRLQQPVVQPR